MTSHQSPNTEVVFGVTSRQVWTNEGRGLADHLLTQRHDRHCLQPPPSSTLGRAKTAVLSSTSANVSSRRLICWESVI